MTLQVFRSLSCPCQGELSSTGNSVILFLPLSSTEAAEPSPAPFLSPPNLHPSKGNLPLQKKYSYFQEGGHVRACEKSLLGCLIPSQTSCGKSFTETSVHHPRAQFVLLFLAPPVCGWWPPGVWSCLCGFGPGILPTHTPPTSAQCH